MNLDRLREILVRDWDPLGYQEKTERMGETPWRQYDFVLPGLLALLENGAGEEAIMAYLADQEAGVMCFPSIGKERLRRPARMLIAAITSRPPELRQP